jgi:hypothetical protein
VQTIQQVSRARGAQRREIARQLLQLGKETTASIIYVGRLRHPKIEVAVVAMANAIDLRVTQVCIDALNKQARATTGAPIEQQTLVPLTECLQCDSPAAAEVRSWISP